MALSSVFAAPRPAGEWGGDLRRDRHHNGNVVLKERMTTVRSEGLSAKTLAGPSAISRVLVPQPVWVFRCINIISDDA